MKQPETIERKTGVGTDSDTSRSVQRFVSRHGRTPTHLDLFSGIGGFALAARWNGLETIAFAEINEYATKVLKQHWPAVPNLGDVRNVTAQTIREPVWLLTGGFPCQPFSVAGLRRASDDERYLWPECCRVMGELRPRFALFENVAGLLTAERGRSYNRVLSDLAALRYDALWNCIPACAIGKPHERDRTWILVVNTDGDHADGEGITDWAYPNPAEWPTSENKPQRNGWLDELVSTGTAQRRESYADAVRVVHGVSDWMDRHHALGNAVVPQIPSMIIRALLDAARMTANAKLTP
jgi:DNA (cytosine-5)-methyltransferase 1